MFRELELVSLNFPLYLVDHHHAQIMLIEAYKCIASVLRWLTGHITGCQLRCASLAAGVDAMVRQLKWARLHSCSPCLATYACSVLSLRFGSRWEQLIARPTLQSDQPRKPGSQGVPFPSW